MDSLLALYDLGLLHGLLFAALALIRKLIVIEAVGMLPSHCIDFFCVSAAALDCEGTGSLYCDLADVALWRSLLFALFLRRVGRGGLSVVSVEHLLRIH